MSNKLHCNLNKLLITDYSLLYCGVMKPLADMPSCLEGGDNRINKV